MKEWPEYYYDTPNDKQLKDLMDLKKRDKTFLKVRFKHDKYMVDLLGEALNDT